MNYPTISEYVEAIKLAEDNMATLTSLRPVLDGKGQPMMTSGNFAVVFKMRDEASGKLFALKCFLREQPRRAEAYHAISDELQYVASPYLIHFQYLDSELFVDATSTADSEFPVILMDWVDGTTLDRFLRQHLNDSHALALLAYQFSLLAAWLLAQPFAHGDIKPDNIIVRPDGTLTLVDYDGMFVPSMQGQKAREFGSPNFRHPARTIDTFDEHIDDFPLISILLSLKAISLDPSLLTRYATPDRLLLCDNDYRDLAHCQLLKELYPSPDSDLNRLIALFTIAQATQSLSAVSFRLLPLKKPAKPVSVKIQEEQISTEVTDEDFANAWTDEYGAEYSQDRKRLLRAPTHLKEYTILQGTKVICNRAFYRCEYMHQITIPNSVTHIGDRAFSWCKSLQQITIPNSVTHIGNNPFRWCDNLTLIDVQTDKYKFQDNALYTSDGKTIISYVGNESSFTIPNSVTHIGDRAFSWCESLQQIIISNSVNHIGDSAFSHCYKLQQISIPNSVTHIGDSAFSHCYKLQQLTIPNSVTHIGDCAFSDCESLQRINIPNSVTHIGDSAFSWCKSLEIITIPNSVTHIGGNPFPDCDKLTLIDCQTDKYIFQDNALYTSDGKTIISYIGKAISFTIPNSVTHIGDNAFWGCESLQQITIPNSVTHIGDSAFSLCDSLQQITIPNSVTHIGDWAFSGCDSLRQITIPKSVTHIGDWAFSGCDSLRQIIIPKGSRNKFENLIPGGKNKLVER